MYFTVNSGQVRTRQRRTRAAGETGAPRGLERSAQ